MVAERAQVFFYRGHIHIFALGRFAVHAMSFTLCLTFTFITFTFANMTQLAKHLNSTDTTDAALAAKVGCDRSMITKIRAGKATPSLRLAAAISRETGVSIEALIPVNADDAA